RACEARKPRVCPAREKREPQAGGGARWPPSVLSAGPDGCLRVKFQVGPRQRGTFLLTGHAIRESVPVFRDRGESAGVLDVIRAQHRYDPARWRTERADDDRAVAG